MRVLAWGGCVGWVLQGSEEGGYTGWVHGVSSWDGCCRECMGCMHGVLRVLSWDACMVWVLQRGGDRGECMGCMRGAVLRVYAWGACIGWVHRVGARGGCMGMSAAEGCLGCLRGVLRVLAWGGHCREGAARGYIGWVHEMVAA